MKKIQKNIISINTIPQPISRLNEKIIPKKNITDSSSHSISNIPSNKKLENTFKDSLEGSISESKTNILIPDSLNNTKSSIGNGNINIKKNKKKRNINEDKNKNINNDEKEGNNKSNENSGKNNEESTKKIDYRFYSNYPIMIINNSIEKVKTKEKSRYWLAVYDKLMKRKNILKILNYYELEKNKRSINQESIKEQLLIIKDFDIYFMKQSNKPFIKYIKGNCIFTKLYLLTIEEINLVLNYINRYKLSITSNNIKSLQEKGNFQKINENHKNFPYNLIYHMGNYMNINIYGFSNFNLQKNDYSLLYNNLNQKFPSNKKIAKLVKLLMINFPKYSFNFFVCYLLSKIRFENFNEKTNEIKNLVYSCNKSAFHLHNEYFNNNIINDSIMHSTYSPLSKYDDDSSREKPILRKYTENDYQQIIDQNLNFEYHTIDNYNNKYYNKQRNNFINNCKNIRTKTNSEKRKLLKKHTESVYLNGYVSKENNLKLNKNSKDGNNSIKNYINSIKLKPSLIIKKNTKNKIKIEKNNNHNSLSQLNKITFPNFVHIKKTNTNYIENGIFKQDKNFKLEKEKGDKKWTENKKDKNRLIINQASSKINTNTKSEETKIGTINKEMTYNMNNSCREEINRENMGIFVVNKRMATDIHDYIDDDSSLEISNRNSNGKNSIFMTPEKKKKYKYYS